MCHNISCLSSKTFVNRFWSITENWNEWYTLSVYYSCAYLKLEVNELVDNAGLMK